MTSHKGTIWGVFVKPEFRGKGISRRLVKEVIDYATKLEGINLVNLTVNESQPIAKVLYSSLGFKVFGLEERALKIGANYFSEEYMKLDLLDC